MTTQPTGAAFSRKRVTRIAAGVASAGVMAGLSLIAAAPASAATDADCLPENTVDATTGGTVADIQTLLDASTSIVCLVGEFVFAADTPLEYNHDVTLHGLTGAVLNGGGISQLLWDTVENDGTLLTIENLRVTGGNGNSFVDDGGAVSADDITVINSTFDNNSGDDGGAIWSYGHAQIINSTFDSNTANPADDGGAIWAYSIGVVNSTFSNNSAGFGGAISAYSVIEVDSSTFVDNTAAGNEEDTDTGSSGGAIWAPTLTVENSTFVENSAQYGGAIASNNAQLVQSTFLDNVATDAANSVSLVGEGGGISLLANIFANHSDSAELGVQFVTESLTDAGANIFSTQLVTETALPTPDPTTAFDVSAFDLFNGVGLASNGGPTQTVALHAGSPAVNFVPTALKSVTVDQRDVPRDDLPDAGAYEYAGPAPAALPNMGAEPSWWVGIAGGVLVALGGVAFFVSRRVKRSH